PELRLVHGDEGFLETEQGVGRGRRGVALIGADDAITVLGDARGDALVGGLGGGDGADGLLLGDEAEILLQQLVGLGGAAVLLELGLEAADFDCVAFALGALNGGVLGERALGVVGGGGFVEFGAEFGVGRFERLFAGFGRGRWAFRLAFGRDDRAHEVAFFFGEFGGALGNEGFRRGFDFCSAILGALAGRHLFGVARERADAFEQFARAPTFGLVERGEFAALAFLVELLLDAGVLLFSLQFAARVEVVLGDQRLAPLGDRNQAITRAHAAIVDDVLGRRGELFRQIVARFERGFELGFGVCRRRLRCRWRRRAARCEERDE